MLSVAATLVIFVATAFDGATTHVSALLLRVVVATTVVVVWPASDAAISWRAVAPAGVAVLAGTLGLLPAPDLGLATQAWVSACLVCSLYLALLVPPADPTRRLQLVATLVAGVHALWALGQLALGATRATAGFFNPNDLAAFLAPLAVLALGRPLSDRRWLAVFTAALLVVGIVSTGSRSGVLALLLGGGVALVTRLRARWQQLVLLGAAVLVIAVGVDRWLGKGDSLAYARLDIWQASASLALANPVGVGLGGYGEAMRVHGVPLAGWVRFPKTASHAHSEVLNAWVEMGWLGLLAVLLPALFMIRVLRRSQAPAVDWGVLLALAVPALVSSSLHVPPVAFLAAVWAAGVVRRDASPGPTLRLPGGARGRWLAGAVAMGAVLLAVPGALSRAAMEHAARLRDAGELAPALRAATWSERLAPWSMGAALMAESLRYLNGEPAARVGERLIELAERAPQDPRPLERALWLIEREAPAEPMAWAAIAELRAELARRDPKNALVLNDLAQAHAKAGDEQAARAAYEAALAIEPNCARSLAHLAVLGHDAGNRETAAHLALRAWQAHAQSPSWHGYGRAVLSLPPELQTMLAERGYPMP